jgi:hypothetical protein
MAHAPQPHAPLPAAPGPGHHASADDEYRFQPQSAGHEHSDASVWIIVKFGLWLAISAVVVSAGMYLLFALFVKQSEETTAEYPLAVGQEHRLPAAPRLQQFPVTEYYEFRQHEEAVLQKYGWVNKETGIVRMPIAEAMKLAVERGLPARAPQPAAAADPSAAPAPTESAAQQTTGTMPADSSAGRTLERRQ